MDKYAVFGNPICQSKSPIIHQSFAAQFGDSISYQAILADKDDFAQAAARFFLDPQARGCNVTLPFKQQAAAWVDKLSPEAELAGAVNTIKREVDGSFSGYNTDGIGLVNDLLARDIQLSAKRILLLGAGGAARGVIHPLLGQQPAIITIANRSKEKAKTLCQLASANNLSACGLAELEQSQRFDIIINSTSASLDNQLPAIADQLIAGAEVIYDMVYGKEDTIFMRHAEALDVPVVLDGLGMLVGQAAQSYKIWRAKQPELFTVLAQLRKQL